VGVRLINLLDRISGAMDVANDLLQGFFHLPRAIFAAAAYIVALYCDTKRRATIPLL